MSKPVTLASLVRVAARNEGDFVMTVESVFAAEDLERVAEFFDKLNIPRSVPGSDFDADIKDLTSCNHQIGDFEQEREISRGIQKFLDRHERKIKWHAGHPSEEGALNVLLLFRCAIMVTTLRLNRLQALLATKDELTPVEWAYAREMMTKSYLSFRNFLTLMSTDWMDAMHQAVPRDDLAEIVGSFYEHVDAQVRVLEQYRDIIEDRRQELTVIPEGFPPVKPPNYFGGDLLGRGPWKQFWTTIQSRAHYFRESIH